LHHTASFHSAARLRPHPVDLIASINRHKTVGAIEVNCGEFNEDFGEMTALFSEFSRQVSGCGD